MAKTYKSSDGKKRMGTALDRIRSEKTPPEKQDPIAEYVYEFIDELQELITDGYTYDQIAEIISEEFHQIAGDTIRKHMDSAMKRKKRDNKRSPRSVSEPVPVPTPKVKPENRTPAPDASQMTVDTDVMEDF